MVQDAVERNDSERQITFCWYNASTYQSVGAPATTLALRIWSVLGGEDPEKLQYADVPADTFNRYMQNFFGIVSRQEGDLRPYELLQQLALKTGQLADFPRLLESHLVKGGPETAKPRKLVLVVDDLDRCSPDFTGEVLDALQRLSSVQNLFVLIGVDREVILAAIRERYKDSMTVHSEHEALEKHIQYTFALPDMTPELLTGYVRRCLEQEEGDDEYENKILRAISEDAAYFVVGVRVKTPRALKRSINAIRPALKMRLIEEPGLSREEQQLVIKERLLAYHWQAFYQRFFQPAQRDPASAEYRIFYHLELLCSRYYSAESAEESPELQRDRRAIFELQLDRIKVREFSEGASLDVSDELARLLAQPPFWVLGREKEKPVGRVPDIGGDMGIFGGPRLDEEFFKFYILSEQADATGDGRASVQAAAQAYELVSRNRQSFGKDVTPQLGNLGVNAEKYKALDLAERIWRLALEIDPEHSGTLQQFASYIVDNRPDLYHEAEAILNKLQTGSHAAHKPWRTLSLLAQFKGALGQELDKDVLARLTEAAETETDTQQLGHILSTVIKADQFQQGVELFTSAIERFSAAKSRYTIQRVVADALAGRPEIESEFIAMDLYRQILANPETIDPGDEPHVMANYATLLYKHDYDDEAGCLWFKAYQFPSGRGSPSIRRAYALYLLRADRGDLAEKVISGEPVDEMVLIPTEKELPERFSDVGLPDALSQNGQSPLFSCIEQSDGSI